MSEMVKWFQEQFPDLAFDMESTTHHYIEGDGTVHINPFHMEGGVWAHQMMVMSQARERKVNDRVRLACLGHDLGKPMAAFQNHEKQRVRFSGHEGFSVFLMEGVFRELAKAGSGLPFWGNKRHVLELINWHQNLFGEVINADTKPEMSQKALKNFGLQNDGQIENLLELMTCDGNGRFGDGHREIDYTGFLENFQGVYAELTNGNFRHTDREITLLIGPPCSGKSTWIEENKTNEHVISRDATVMDMATKGIDYDEAWASVDQKEVDRQLQLRFNIAKKVEGLNIIIDMTNMSKKTRRKWLNVPKHWKRKARVFITSMDELNARNRQRPGKIIPEQAMHRMIGAFHAPLYSEFDEIEWVFT